MIHTSSYPERDCMVCIVVLDNKLTSLMVHALYYTGNLIMHFHDTTATSPSLTITQLHPVCK